MAGGLFSGNSDDIENDEVVEGIAIANSESGTADSSPGGMFGDGAATSDASRSANAAADDSERYAEASKGWAVGNDDGSLDSWSDTNNSKYYADEASDSADNAAASAVTATTQATSASGSATSAQASATAASTSASQSSASATQSASSADLSEDWAVGLNPVDGTPSDTNNSHYWATQAANSASTASGHNDDADEAAARAQGWAIGQTSDDSNQDNWSTTNNAKYYSDEAQTHVTEAQGFANDSQGYANESEGFRDQAEGYKDDAASSATAANLNATQAAQSAASAITARTAAETSQAAALNSANDSASSAGLSQDWAIGPSGTDDTPSDTNNAHYWALQAQAATDFPEGYPDIPNHESSAIRYELNVPANTGDATWVEVDAASELTAGNGISITNDEVAVVINGSTLSLDSSGLSVTNPFTDSDESKLDSIPDIPGADTEVKNYELRVDQDGNTTWEETVAHIDDLPAVPNNESTTIRYELNVPANSGDATWVEVDAAGELSGGDGISITSDTVAVDLYEPTGNFKNAAIITSNKLDVSYETETKNDRLYLDGIFGRRIRGFDNDNGIELATYVYNDVVFDYQPRQTLHWDEPLTDIVVTATNNADYQEEYITSIKTSVDSNEVDTTTFTMYIASPSKSVDSSELGIYGMDARTGAYNGQAGGERTVTVEMSTNEGKTDTQTSSFSWASAGIENVSVTDPVVIEFDTYLTSYDLSVRVVNTGEFSNIVNEQVVPDSGFGDTTSYSQSSRTQSVTVNSGVDNIYHDTTITGSVEIDFRRPTTVSAESQDNRTYSASHSYSHGASIIYKTWQILASDLGDFSVSSDLGSLNAGGYATQATRSADTSTTAWKSANYSFDNSSGTSAVHGYIVAPSSGSTFQDRDLGFGTVAHTSTSENLGHSGHTIAYTVYTFVVAAGKHLRLEVLS